MMLADLAGEMLVVIVGGHKIGFRVHDRLLICPDCGNTSRPPSTVCYGCDSRPLIDPLRKSKS